MKETHLAVLNILKNNTDKGFLLDAAGGDGDFALRLRGLGYKAVLCDLYLPRDIIVPFVQADMNNLLPFKADGFDFITCMESLQYLENHKQLFREFTRVLKENGNLVVTMPNILNCASRLFFLRAGYFPSFKPFRKIKDGCEWDNIIYSPVSFIEVFQWLSCNGFKIETIEVSRYRYREWLLFLLLRGAYKLISVFKRNKRENVLRDFLYSKELLLGDHLIIIARKLPPA
ncbi:MAG: hypothetical protein A2073_00275 [Deltaproteobacteria bacterium GWC2_42_11]|nr:MAG: hypothetical protein A2073_00275 [Deltaproteobacteria bacterium GWC2_42_11]HBO83779.1 hypothetical protein [Deltaproteobacteria bacterium]